MPQRLFTFARRFGIILTMTAVPVTTHLFLVALPLAILAASVGYFFFSGRRRGR